MRIIAGPCQHESLEQSLEIAGHCKEVCDKYEFEYIFKASFDKANRTHVSGIRGRGLNATLASFLNMKEEIPQLRTLTDVHSVEDIWELVDHFNDAVDVLQIPAFLCRQTDIIEAACETDKIVNIKCDPKLSKERFTLSTSFYEYFYSKCPLITDYITKKQKKEISIFF